MPNPGKRQPSWAGRAAAHEVFSALDRPLQRRTLRSGLLPGGVMAAQATLTRLVLVRIQAGQPLWGKSNFSRVRSKSR